MRGRNAMARESASEAETTIKIDAYNHYLPPPYLELLMLHAKDAGIVRGVDNDVDEPTGIE